MNVKLKANQQVDGPCRGDIGLPFPSLFCVYMVYFFVFTINGKPWGQIKSTSNGNCLTCYSL